MKLNSVASTASILRNQRGKSNADIGMGNEKLINQLVAHHGIIFQPEKRLVWISTAPWQLGKFVCYDLNKIFAIDMQSNTEIAEVDKTIPADPFLGTPAYSDYQKFSKYRFPFHPREDLVADSIVVWNPGSYHAYMLAGDRAFDDKQFSKASQFYERGLTLEIATLQEKEHMEKRLAECKNKLE